MGFLDFLFKKEESKVVNNSPDALRYGAEGGEGGLRARLEYIIATEWSGYELYKEVLAADLGAEQGARNYSYGLFLNGEPKAMIMLIDDNNHYRRSDVVKAREACERMGVPYMNFMTYMSNRGDYISNRLRENVLR